MSGVWGATVAFVLYLAFAGAVMFVASHYLGTGGRIVAFLVVAPPAISWWWFPWSLTRLLFFKSGHQRVETGQHPTEGQDSN
jgi:hypothetical protein